jgi:hypothetical protein
MTLQSRVRRLVVAAALASTIAGALGAADAARADTAPPTPPVADVPPVDDAPAETDGSVPAPTTTLPAPTTTAPPAAPPSTAPPSTEPPAESPTTTTPPVSPPKTTQPPGAIATTTTTPNAVPVPVAVTAATAPQSLAATAGNAIVKLTWKAPANNGGATVDKYAVQRSANGTTGWGNVAFPTSPSYNVGALANGTKYYFRVLAHNSVGWGAASSAVAATPRTVPSAPLSPVATPSNGSVKLTWKAPTSNGGAAIIRYAVQRYNTVSKKWENVAFPTTLSYTNTSLANGTKYSYRILAQNPAGWGTPSGVVAVTPNGPSAPLSPVATPGNSKVTLTWSAPATSGAAPIKKYAVQSMIPGVTGWENIAFPTTRSYTAFGLNGTKYSFRILAYTDIGWGPASTTVSAVPRTVPGAPFAVQTTPADAYVGLEWSGTPNGGATIDKYRVRMATSLDGPWQTFEGSQPSTQGGFGSLVNGTTYYFQVAAHNAAGWGQYSWTVNATPRTVPAAPGLTATPETPNWIKLNWTRPAQNGGAPVESYRFEQAPGPNGPWTLAATTAVAADKVSGHAYVGGLEPGTTYHFRAAAVNAAGQGPDTAAITATTPATLPGAPTACSAVESSYHMAYLDWSAPASNGGSPIINYNVLIQKGEYKYQWVGNWGYWYWAPEANVVNYDTVGPFTDYTEVLPAGDYRIAIRARNSVGQGPGCAAEVHIT